jgi:hypothetical protein
MTLRRAWMVPVLALLLGGALQAQFRGFNPEQFYLDRATRLEPLAHPPVRTQYGLGFCYAAAAATLVDYERLRLRPAGSEAFGEGDMLSLLATLLMANDGTMAEGGLIGATLERIQHYRAVRPELLLSEKAAPYEPFQLALFDKKEIYARYDALLAKAQRDAQPLNDWERQNLLARLTYNANNTYWEQLKGLFRTYLTPPPPKRDPQPILAHLARMTRACVQPEGIRTTLQAFGPFEEARFPQDWNKLLSRMLSQVCRAVPVASEVRKPLEVPRFRIHSEDVFTYEKTRGEWMERVRTLLRERLKLGRPVGVGICMCEELHSFAEGCPAGHAIVISGWGEVAPVGKPSGKRYQALRIQNSWGEEWQAGFLLREGSAEDPKGAFRTGWMEADSLLIRVSIIEWIE